MPKRKYLTIREKLACTLRMLGDVTYEQSKTMSADALISKYDWHHNMRHWTQHKHVDKWWNYEPMLRAKHRELSKQDSKDAAKSRRIRRRGITRKMIREELLPGLMAVEPPRVRKIRSRGFDKTLRRKMNGTVEKR